MNDHQTILIAEDEADFRHELGAYLERQGYRVVAVEDGYQALEFAVREQPDLLLLDVHMPAGDGFRVHERIAKHPDLEMIPVIYMTHDPSEDVDDTADATGGFALLYKPFEMEYLLEVVHAALRSYGAEAA